MRAQIVEDVAPARERADRELRVLALDAVLGLGDVAEREAVHAGDGRVVEQPQQPAVGDGEDGARAKPTWTSA